MHPRKIELLAPARDLACGIAAINHGADAVYIGPSEFGARAAAGNSLEDIERLVLHAHQFGARVYVTLNTLFDDQELERAVRLSHRLHEAGVDALIIQDVGLLECELPPIPLHASTQMNNRSARKVAFWEEVGLQQVVLARELSLETIREIRAATSVPLEFFVHGALCVSYSGQCYISEVMAGRSANRGECAQFCRHRFTLQDGLGNTIERDRYLLSLKDLDLSSHLGALIDAGISSFKIEGRLKDENYVKNVTACYRLALDGLIDGDDRLQRASSGSCSFDFIPDTGRSFNRGKTEYFLLNKRNTPGSIDTPKSIGQKIGRVLRADKHSFTLQGRERLHNGDGLCFLRPGEGLVGVRVNRVEGESVFPRDAAVPPEGAVIYRNLDVAFNKCLAQSGQRRRIGLRIELREVEDGLLLAVLDEDGVSSETVLRVEGTMTPPSSAPDATAVRAERQLKKCGGTIFSVEEITLDLDPAVSYPAAVLNDLRRRGLQHHLQERLQRYEPERAEIEVNDCPWPAQEVSYLDNIANQKAEDFFRRHGVAQINRSELRAADVDRCALMTTRYCLKAQLKGCPKQGNHAAIFEEPLILVDNTGEYELGFDCEACEMTLRRRRLKDPHNFG